MSKSVLKWEEDVADHDYAAAYNYLSLRLSPVKATGIVRELKGSKVETRRANDILRACGRPPLGIDDPGVRENFDRTLAGEALSPILMVTFDIGGEIADGYHRVSWAYEVSPYTDVPLKIVYCKV